jgi:MFS family permease
MMMGFAVAVTTAVTDAWINDKTPDDRRGRVIAIYAMVLGVASVLSQMAFFFLDAGSNGFVLMFAIAMNCAVVLVALTSARSRPPHRRKLLRRRPRYLQASAVFQRPLLSVHFRPGSHAPHISLSCRFT